MARSARRFARLLTEAIYRIRFKESRLIQAVQDELGYALGKAGGSAIEYWRKGHIPAQLEEVENLAAELVRREGLSTGQQIQAFLASAGHPDVEGCCARLLAERGRHFPSPKQPGTSVQTDVGTPPQIGRSIEELAPFVVGPPIAHPRQFFGREFELRRIYNLWRRFPLQNVAVIGLHRSGKTSLLHYVKTIPSSVPAQLRPGQRVDWLPQAERYQWVLVDFQDARMCSRERLLRYILDELQIPVPEPCDLSRFMDAVSEHLRNPALILMDEIDVALQSPELDLPFWWSLRSLACNQTGGNLGFLLTSHEAPGQLAEQRGKPSPFFNIFGHTLTLGPLSEAEANELILSSPQPFAPAEAKWILEHSQGWPALLQILCNTRLSWLENARVDEGWKEEGLRQIAPYRYLLDDG
jgi:hypothetical protein